MDWTIKLEARTGWGTVETTEVARLERRVVGLTAEGAGLSLDEAKSILAELQRQVLQTQLEEYTTCARVCPGCLERRRRRDRRTRTIQTLFGTVTVDAPRIRVCACQDPMGLVNVSISPLAQLLPDRCTPELRRVQAELGARHSFREVGRLLSALLPCPPPNHASVRNRLARVADALEAGDSARGQSTAGRLAAGAGEDEREVTVLIDGAHIRAAPGQQSRHLDVTVGKVEAAAEPARRFALAPDGARHPAATVRAALLDGGWRQGEPVTVISDGEPALPALVRAAAAGTAVTHVLDWWHVSARVRHVEQAVRGVYALQPQHQAGLDTVAARVGRLRHLLWNGYRQEAACELFGLQHLAREAVFLNGDRLRLAVDRLVWHCEDLRGYLANNDAALVDHGSRHREGLPVSTSRAEGCVEEIANARMAKRRRMRWSRRGAHRVATVRAAVLDRRPLGRGLRRSAG